MSNHTPGPWFIDSEFPKLEAGKDLEIHSSTLATHVANVCDWGEEHDDEKEANAYLIAAAPRMLRALKAIDDFLSDKRNDAGAVRDEVKLAISKAEGGSHA